MKNKFDLKYLESIGDYDVPMTEQLTDKSIDSLSRLSEGVGTITRWAGKKLRNLDRFANKFHSAAKSGGAPGVLMGLTGKDLNDKDFVNSYMDSINTKNKAFTYKGKKYKITPELENSMNTILNKSK